MTKLNYNNRSRKQSFKSLMILQGVNCKTAIRFPNETGFKSFEYAKVIPKWRNTDGNIYNYIDSQPSEVIWSRRKKKIYVGK